MACPDRWRALAGAGPVSPAAAPRPAAHPPVPSPRLPGDLLAALLLAWCERHPGDLASAAEKAVASLQAVLRVTSRIVEAEEARLAAAGAGAAARDGPKPLLSSRERTAAVFRAKELRLVQSQAELVDPRVELRAEPLAR
jgi:pyridoxal/pyridoxine/pyridoxamine kinase